MAATNDTIDGLLAEFRGYSAGMPPSYHVTMSWADFRKMLDRFDAAHKRERGDAAKLREACANIAEYARSAMCHATDTHVLGYLNQIEGWANAAIAAPARNCDVGTAEEQTIRFNKFCLDNRTENDFGCGDCKCNSEDSKKCEFLWAQMPCEEGGAK